MILTGPAICEAIERGDIGIDPFLPIHVNPASIDLRLSPHFMIYDAYTFDCKKSVGCSRHTMSEEGLLLAPGQLYLMATLEVLRTDKYVTVIDGKSSAGRLGLSVHQTAGYGDPGYYGQYTLEVSCLMPIVVYPTMRICQARFHELSGPVVSYRDKGHYVNLQGPVIGPQPSQLYRQWM